MKFVYWKFLVLCIFQMGDAFAQTATYGGIENGGAIPSEILKSASEKSLENIEEAKGIKEGRRRKKDREVFYYESNFFVDQLLTSGKVCFNNSIYWYLNKVADHLLKNDRATRERIQIYPVKIPSVNAFATDRGIIFVDIGLLARLENEAQLAFVLAHEMAHYIKKHNIEFYFESKRIDRKSREYSRISSDAAILEQSKYSRENELEADDYGFELFSKAGYNQSEALKVMDILLYSDLPYKYNLPFEKSLLESRYMKFPTVFFKDSLSPVTVNAKEEDKYSSHPNIFKRKEMLEKNMEAGKNGELFIVAGKNEFEKIEYICKHEQLSLLIKYNYYLEAIYHATLLSKESNDSLFIKKGIAKALMGLSRYSGTGEFRRVLPPTKKIKNFSGEPQRLYYLFNRLKPEEITILAIRYTWDLAQLFPEDAEIKVMCKSAIMDYKFGYAKDLKKFDDLKNYNDSIIESYYKDGSLTTEKKNKGTTNNKILKTKKASTKSFTIFALSDLKTNKVFLDFFNDVKIPVSLKAFELTEGDGEQVSSTKKNKKKPIFLNDAFSGNSKLIIIDPDYIFVDTRKENPVNYVVGEEKRNHMRHILTKCSEKSGLEIELITTKNIDSANIKLFNDICLIKERTDEFYRNLPVCLTAVDYSRVNKFADEHGSRFICLITNISVIEKKDYYDYYYTILVGLYAPIYLPYLIYQMATRKQATMIEVVIYDALTGEVNYQKMLAFATKDRDDILKSQFYNLFLQLKHK